MKPVRLVSNEIDANKHVETNERRRLQHGIEMAPETRC